MNRLSSHNTTPDLSFSAKQDLHIPEPWDGSLWRVDSVDPMPHRHTHDELEFNLVLSGRAAYLLGDRRYELRRHTLVWLFPGQSHILLDKSPDYAMWLGLLKPSMLARLCTTPETRTLCEDDPPGSFCKRLDSGDSHRLNGLFTEISEARGDHSRFNAGLGFAVLSAWSAFAEADEAAGMEIHPGIEQAIRLVHDGTADESLDVLAAHVGMSASHLGRLFREQVGVGLPEFRNRVRLERFLRVYRTQGPMTILEAALEAGFGSYPQFHRVFTAEMGCSPAEYLKKSLLA